MPKNKKEASSSDSDSGPEDVSFSLNPFYITEMIDMLPNLGIFAEDSGPKKDQSRREEAVVIIRERFKRRMASRWKKVCKNQ